MRNIFTSFFPALLALAIAGCVDSDRNRADRATQELNEIHEYAARQWCNCYADIEGSASSCMRRYYVQVEFNDCQRNAITCHVDDFENYLQCENSAAHYFAGCTAQCPESVAARRDCLDEYDWRRNDCMERMPRRLQMSLTSCALGGQPTCADW